MTKFWTKYWNRILTNTDRTYYEALIEDMWLTVPEMMSRKIGAANVQQAFVVDAINEFSGKNSSIFCVGTNEDTAYSYIIKKGQYLYTDGIDPVFNYDLHTFVVKHWDKVPFDIVFSCSVIEHVRNDEEFLDDIIKLLLPGGVAILTCDFKNDYVSGQRVPFTSCRFYTNNDLKERLGKIIKEKDCSFIGSTCWDKQPYDFNWEGIPYDFATIVFKKDGKNEYNEYSDLYTYPN